MDKQYERGRVSPPCGIGKQGSETNRSLWALLGLKTYPNNITPSQAGGRDWKTIKQKLEDEKKTVQSRGWVGLRHENRYGMESERDTRRRRDHSNFSECVCVCASTRVGRVCEPTARIRLCFAAYVTRLSVFFCHCVCVSVRASVCECVCADWDPRACMYGGVEGHGARWGEEERHDINNSRGL